MLVYVSPECLDGIGIGGVTLNRLELGRRLASGFELHRIPAGDDHLVPEGEELLRQRQTNTGASAR